LNNSNSHTHIQGRLTGQNQFGKSFTAVALEQENHPCFWNPFKMPINWRFEAGDSCSSKLLSENMQIH
jgi:hypothetical protein